MFQGKVHEGTLCVGFAHSAFEDKVCEFVSHFDGHEIGGSDGESVSRAFT